DSGVGKTGLGWRLAHGHFKEHASTHGQQFWVCEALGAKRRDGTECEAVLWDLAGQPDYRLIHSLFLDDADLALVLFDPTDSRDPLHGVEFWLKQLSGERATLCQIVLVSARCDRGDSRLTQEELESFCRARGLAGYVRTSAQSGEGIDVLLALMKELVDWENKSATTTSATFKRIKDYVLGLKQDETDKRVIVSAEDLRARLKATDASWEFTDDEMRTAVGHLETYGYVRRLRTSRGEGRILLAPELLNNLAASFVLEARRNAKGLGALEERRLLGDGERYALPELASLPAEAQTILTDAAALLFIEHHVCFRETDPLTRLSFVIFPELINLKRPVDEEKAPEEGAAYTVSGAVENVFASLVVLLGYTSTFTRIAHWQNNARYEVADGTVCGFRLVAEGDGELDLTLCFSSPSRPVRRIFEGLFESCLGRRNLSVTRHEPIHCGKCGNRLDRAVIRQQREAKKNFAFCSNCGKKLKLAAEEPIQQAHEHQTAVETQRHQAEARTRFETAIFRVQAYVTEQKIKPPQCFISYAWGVKEHERWVEKSLATDLQKAGIDVLLDRWENGKIGASVSRFVARIEKADRVIVVGTPDFRRKYENRDSATGYVVAAEVDVLENRLLGTEAQKESVLPALLAGEKTSALPPLLHGRVYADFRRAEDYFLSTFTLIRSLYNLEPTHPAVADLIESLRMEPHRM
ncbi:MAG TPA: TIR domain-containing protein, partial [Chthoniobacteraceae bacterium]|nr:TIR domain-containing protein [Chthoniobacteraceae bacterium]